MMKLLQQQQQNRTSIRRKNSSCGGSNINNGLSGGGGGTNGRIRHSSGSSNHTTSNGWMRYLLFPTNNGYNNKQPQQRRLLQCIGLACITIVCIQFVTVLPIFLVLEQSQPRNSNSTTTTTTTKSMNQQQQQQRSAAADVATKAMTTLLQQQYPTHTTKDGRTIPMFTMSDLASIYPERQHEEEITGIDPSVRLLRGINTEVLLQQQQQQQQSTTTKTTAIVESLVGAHHANITCPDLNVNSLAYWNDPIGTRDLHYQSPFRVYGNNNNNEEKEKENEKDVYYISFAPDQGGWNNIRMSMEIIFVIAAATGRTLILPPKEPLYLLHHDAKQKHRGFADFFPIHTNPHFQHIVKTITFEEFLRKEGQQGPLSVETMTQQQQQMKQSSDKNEEKKDTVILPTYEQLLQTADHCDKRKDSSTSCTHVYNYLRHIGHTPDISAAHTCLIFNEAIYMDPNVELSPDDQGYIQLVCGEKRTPVYFNHDETIRHRVLHFQADQQQYRLLTHFYNMIHFTNPVDDHYYKRFVRDFLHYHDSIYCAAGKIVKALQLESAILTSSSSKSSTSTLYRPDSYGAGGYSALHVRRGDLQYKKVKISAAEWYNNTQEIWRPQELLYIATDERDKSFFDDLAKHHTLRFLDDYWDMAGLSDLDPNYMGMIDTIVASRGRAFAGTWFSTFSGYINRLRGYHGMSMNQSWYSFLPKKTAVQEWHIVDDFVYAYEFPDGWIGIDADVFPTRDIF